MTRVARAMIQVLAAVMVLSGCHYDPYCVNCADGTTVGGDAVTFEVAPVDVLHPTVDAQGDGTVVPDGCTPGATEVCNGVDDNCDGRVDEGFELQTDPRNCGACGAPCALAHAIPGCVAGRCVVPDRGCDTGFYDLDHESANGCEYACTPVPGAMDDRTCDARDDDCNGRVDDGVDLCGDVHNCGACGHICATAHATAGCVSMGGSPCVPVSAQCQIAHCDTGFFDFDHDASNGCETACTARGSEVCNGVDDDCNGIIDDGDPGGGGVCGQGGGACRTGLEHCMTGRIQCIGSIDPALEVCNGLDDDCDAVVDNGFDLSSDVSNCGVCGRSCASVPNAVSVCQMGVCAVVACAPGFVDLDHDPGNGCEYGCLLAGPSEVCNGLDDNCDGRVDEGLVAPAAFCAAAGACAGAVPVCLGARGFVCGYSASVETDSSTGQPAAVETRCDGVDNNCNGLIDESFGNLGTSCSNLGVGACGANGQFVCNVSGSGTTCDAPGIGSPRAEQCNGLDDDCDGLTDETRITPGADPSYVHGAWTQYASGAWIMTYEASRPDATGSNPGLVGTRACSTVGVLPWTNLTAAQAENACEAAGGRLCGESEWQTACRSATGSCAWSYETGCDTYQPSACNGVDNDIDAATPGTQHGLIPTGALAQCSAAWGTDRIFDMSGNAREFTVARSPGNIPLRGGAYNNLAGGTGCAFDWTLVDASFAFVNAGFRCCFAGARAP